MTTATKTASLSVEEDQLVDHGQHHSKYNNNNNLNNQRGSQRILRNSVSISGVAEFDESCNNEEEFFDKEHAVLAAVTDATTGANIAAATPSSWTNVASASHGARILFATDEWFAVADNLLKDSPPYFDPDEYCEQGKVMDGWESRRRREAGHDWCVLELAGGYAQILAVELDTAYFTGNHVPAVSLELANLSSTQATNMVRQFPGVVDRLLNQGGVQGTGMTPTQVHQAEQACRSVQWQEILPKTPLRPGLEATRHHYFELPTPCEGTHLRVNYFPDGGVARLRLWGSVLAEQRPRPKPGPAYAPQTTGPVCTVVPHSIPRLGIEEEPLDDANGHALFLPSQQPYEYPELSCRDEGGVGLLCSNRHYGIPDNLIQPTLGRDMGDGWETARHPNRPSILIKDPKTNLVDSPLMDWCVLKLGSVAHNGVARIILDTKHFRGNYPESVQVDGCFLGPSPDDAWEEGELDMEKISWFPLIARCRMSPDSEHVFERCRNQIFNGERPVTHVKVSIFPDGGLSRVRVYG